MNELADRLYQQMLVIRCQAGDGAALEELIRQCQPALRAFLHKMLPHEAEDVAQDVWMDVYRDLPRLKDAGSFLPWLYRIAHHRILRHLRRRRPATSDIDGLEIGGPEPPDFVADEAQAVHDALSDLDLEHREVLLLRFIQEMTYEQIAQALDCPIGTVRSRIHHAKLRLRAIIERKNCYERK